MGDAIDRMLLRHAGIDERKTNDGPPDGDERRGFGAEKPSKPEQVISRVGALWGSLALIGGTLVAVGVLSNPLETKAHANEVHAEIDKRLGEHEQRLNRVDQNLSEILTAGKETQELQLMDRVQQLNDRLTKMQAGSDIYDDYRQQKNEAEQRLTRIRRELRKATP